VNSERYLVVDLSKRECPISLEFDEIVVVLVELVEAVPGARGRRRGGGERGALGETVGCGAYGGRVEGVCVCVCVCVYAEKGREGERGGRGGGGG
jgi:hypothetical protein